MIVETPIGRARFCVLIPTRGRAALVHKQLSGPMAHLIHPGVYYGVADEDPQRNAYRSLISEVAWGGWPYVVPVLDKVGSCGMAREYLRASIFQKPERHYDYAVMTDDNARFTRASLDALVSAAHVWNTEVGLTFMAGMHSTAMHFDRNNIDKKEERHGLTTYPAVGFIFHCVPISWLRTYSYPGDCFALEDRHMMFTAIRAGCRSFRVCMDAPFGKSRYQEGGQGSITDRMWKCGRSIERLAHDFPTFVGARGTFPTAWKFIMEMADGQEVDRLPGGAMRRADQLVQRQKTGAQRHGKISR